jgi:hypothetical protein
MRLAPHHSPALFTGLIEASPPKRLRGGWQSPVPSGRLDLNASGSPMPGTTLFSERSTASDSAPASPNSRWTRAGTTLQDRWEPGTAGCMTNRAIHNQATCPRREEIATTSRSGPFSLEPRARSPCTCAYGAVWRGVFDGSPPRNVCK